MLLLVTTRDRVYKVRLSGKTKEHKLKLFGPDIFWWGGGLRRDREGTKKFGTSIETQGKLFGVTSRSFFRSEKIA